jgi:hypothetical protein
MLAKGCYSFCPTTTQKEAQINASPIVSKEELVITYYQDAIQGWGQVLFFESGGGIVLTLLDHEKNR